MATLFLPPTLPAALVVLVVVDDIHLLSAAAAAELTWLVEHAPPSLQLVVLGRNNPLGHLNRLRACGGVVELHHTDLPFTVDETAALLRRLLGSDHPGTYTTWTMKLHPGITFHDGTPFNAAAVVTALQRSAVTGFVGQSLSEINGAGPGNDPAGVAITAIDDLTVQIETSRAWPALPYYLASRGAFMPSPTWYEQVFANPAAPDAEAGARPVGTGPFKFVSWKPGDSLIVEKNPDYWRKDAAGNGIPYLDGIEFRVIPDELTRAKGLEDDQLDFMPTDLGENIKRFRNNDDFTLIEQSELTETIYTPLHVGQADSPLAACGAAWPRPPTSSRSP